MKKLLLLVSIFLIASTLTFCFTSCSKDNKSESEVGFDISGYEIVYPSMAGDDLISAATALRNRIEKCANLKLNIKEDFVAADEEVSGKEIIVGESDRAETVALKAKLDTLGSESAFAIEVIGNKIVVLGMSEDITIHAIKYFVNNFVDLSQKEGTIALDKSYNKAHMADENMIIIPEELVGFVMSEQYLVFEPEHGTTSQSTNQYPTATYLQYQKNEADNGTMLATLNSGESFYRIFRSTDDGKNWEQITEVYETNPDNYGAGVSQPLQAGRMPFLYELPAKVGEFEKGTIFLAGTSSPPKGTAASYERTAITMYYSTDIGKTWTALPSVDYGKGKIDGNGVWEPFLIYEEKTGRVYCFYSDATQDKVEGQHDQRLVYKYSTDMKNWTGETGTGSYTEPFEAIASADYKHRPGMVAVSKMTNGEYILTYEFVGSKVDATGSTTFYKTTTRLDDWGDPADMGKVVITDEGETSGSGPWSAYTPVGGDNGIFFVFARFKGDYRDGDFEQPDIFISFDYGRTYRSLENPFKYNHIGNTDEDRSGYSVMFLVSPDGKTMYFFNNPPYGVSSQTISMVRIDIIP